MLIWDKFGTPGLIFLFGFISGLALACLLTVIISTIMGIIIRREEKDLR